MRTEVSGRRIDELMSFLFHNLFPLGSGVPFENWTIDRNWTFRIPNQHCRDR